MKKRKKDKPPSLREKRGAFRAELRENLRIVKVEQHKPWTYVHFHSSYKDPNTNESIKVGGWGVSKICWPDKWDEDYGVDIAVERGLAWLVKSMIPPLPDATFDTRVDLSRLSDAAIEKLEKMQAQSQEIYISE